MATAEHLERNQWGWGKIRSLDGSGYEWYPRISTIAKVYQDKTNIEAWGKRHVAIGVAQSQNLQQQILLNSKNNKLLNDLCEQALVESGGKEAAETGTLLHDLTEQLDAGLQPHVPPDLLHVTNAYQLAIAQSGLKPYQSEQFVVNDELRVCGSFDRSWVTPDGAILIGDLKTGAHAHRYPHSVAMQIAMYANGVLYDPVTEERTPLGDVSKEHGLLIHAPLKGGCRIIRLELAKAYEWVRLAVQSRAWHKETITQEWGK